MVIYEKVAFSCCIIIFVFYIFYVGTYNVLAHESTLDVEYDDCDATDYVSLTDIGDGYLEKWYELVRNGQERHIAHDSTGITTIRYYISPIGQDSTTTWITGISNTMSETIINGFISSIEKWNNVYYYVIANDGIYEKRKIVNVIEGTVDNHNLTIYPTISTSFLCPNHKINPDECKQLFITEAYIKDSFIKLLNELGGDIEKIKIGLLDKISKLLDKTTPSDSSLLDEEIQIKQSEMMAIFKKKNNAKSREIKNQKNHLKIN